MEMSSFRHWIVFLVYWYSFLNYGVSGFEYKTLCLVDHIPSEEELEGEGREWGGYGMAQSSWAAPVVGYPGAAYGGGGEADENEMEGDEGGWNDYQGEMDEFEGQEFGYGGWPGQSNMTGPNWNRGGFMDADGEWEDAKKRRRRRKKRWSRKMMALSRRSGSGLVRSKRQLGGPPWRRISNHTPQHLKGKLACHVDSKIHILNATLGFTMRPSCAQPGAYRCQGSSSKATQILNCQGMSGNCDVTIARHFLSRCGRRLNFALIGYECIPASRNVNICSNHDSDVTGGVVITSPSYPMIERRSPTNGQTDDILTCECTIRAPAETYVQMEYLRATLPGHHGSCDGDLLLLEKPEPTNDGRYTVVSEICGTNYTTKPVKIYDNILRITFLGGSPVTGQYGGFISKFNAISADGSISLFHMTCEPPPEIGVQGENLGSLGNPSGQTGGNGDNGNGQFVDAKKNKPGVLSGVIASLASVILIMGSIGALLVYRTVKHRRQEQERRARRRQVSSSSQDYETPGPPGPSTSQFFRKPRQIVRTPAPTPPADSSSPAAPDFPAPRCPGPKLSCASIYSVALDMPSEDESESSPSPKLADLSSLPRVVPNSPVRPPRKKREDEMTPTPSPRPSPSTTKKRRAKGNSKDNAETPYDNAKRGDDSRGKGVGKRRSHTVKAKEEESTALQGTGDQSNNNNNNNNSGYEEPRRKSCISRRRSSARSLSVGVDVHVDKEISDDDVDDIDEDHHDHVDNNSEENETCTADNARSGKQTDVRCDHSDGHSDDVLYSYIDDVMVMDIEDSRKERYCEIDV